MKRFFFGDSVAPTLGALSVAPTLSAPLPVVLGGALKLYLIN